MIQYAITCPRCGHQGDGVAFSASCADECACPECEYCFQFEYPEEDDGDDE